MLNNSHTNTHTHRKCSKSFISSSENTFFWFLLINVLILFPHFLYCVVAWGECIVITPSPWWIRYKLPVCVCHSLLLLLFASTIVMRAVFNCYYCCSFCCLENYPTWRVHRRAETSNRAAPQTDRGPSQPRGRSYPALWCTHWVYLAAGQCHRQWTAQETNHQDAADHDGRQGLGVWLLYWPRS